MLPSSVAWRVMRILSPSQRSGSPGLWDVSMSVRFPLSEPLVMSTIARVHVPVDVVGSRGVSSNVRPTLGDPHAASVVTATVPSAMFWGRDDVSWKDLSTRAGVFDGHSATVEMALRMKPMSKNPARMRWPSVQSLMCGRKRLVVLLVWGFGVADCG